MRFSRLEIKGFKSFANDTVIHFNEDVIGIVGPNGSGKSNIVDAIRWVLGEQKSAELRLDKMSSVIFNGSKNKKPAGMAQVSLVFENNKNILPVEYNEVKVTRILYHSGESEYKLNNVACRLKDIYSLFADTGIGSNTYAIIGFGMVEDLLNNKDNYRRMMIEQAAGISKYKSRKKETLSKLQTTNDDLNRVDDLLTEIESNMNSLKKQARRAEKYLELKAKHRDNALILFHYQKEQAAKGISNAHEMFVKEQQAAESKEIEIHNAEAQLEAKKNTLLEQEVSLSDFQKRTNQILDEQKTLEKKRELAIQRISFVRSKAEQANKDSENIKVKLAELKSKTDSLNGKIPELDTQITGMNHELGVLQEQYEKVKAELVHLESGLEPITRQFEQNNNRLFALEKENAVAQAQLTTLQSDEGRFKEQESSLRRQKETLDEQKAEYTDKLSALDTHAEGLQQEINARNEELKLLNEARDEASEKKKKAERSIDRTSHEMKLLKSLIDNQEGYPEAVRFLSSQQKDTETLLLADLINCEERYRTSLENYLSPYLTHLVVNDYQEAFRMTEALSASQKGKAGFIILEAFKDKTVTSVEIEGALPLTSIVQCHPKYNNLFRHLLYGAYIVSDIKKSYLEAMEQEHSLHFISEDGSMVVSHGHATGGSIGLIEGSLLGRKIRLESLEGELIELKKADSAYYVELANIEDKIAAISVESKGSELEKILKEAQHVRDALLQIKVKTEHNQLQLDRISADDAALKKKVNDFSELIQKNLSPIATLKEEQKTLQASVQGNKETIREKSEALSTTGNLVNSAKMNAIQAENHKSSLLREIDLLTQQATGLIEQEKQILSIQSSGVVEMATLEAQIQESENAIVEIAEKFKAAQSELTEVERLYFTEKKQVNEDEQAIKLLQRSLSGILTIANEWKDKWNAAKFEMQRIEDNFSIEFGTPPPDDYEKSENTDDAALKDLESQNQKIRNSIQQFGEVNPLAVEAYQEIKTRYDEIVNQKNDILESKDKLMQTLNELEATSTTKYLAAYEQVRENFKMVFRSLFTDDDDCDLVIENPGTPLDSDIGIIARPKGKRPQSLSQLSGGEKTLTAIAFLFSLYLLKPAPFCIFDELDAPLDDINVEKLNKIIRKFSKESQFIIITHNKATMAEVDVMYGVYMEQQGISGLSMVDFRSFEHNLVLEKV